MCLVRPITRYIMEYLPEEMRQTNSSELFFEDLGKLPDAEVAFICDWLVQQVVALSTDLKEFARGGKVRVCKL